MSRLFRFAEAAVESEFDLVLTGSLTEASGGSPDGSRWAVQIIDAGVSINGTDYPLAVLHEAAPLFDGAKVILRSDEDHLAGRGKRADMVVGWIEKPKPNATGLGGEMVLHGGGKSGELRESIKSAWALGKKDLVGLSIAAAGQVKLAQVGGRLTRTAQKIVKVGSVDVIVDPSAGGRLTQMVAGVDPHGKESLMNLEKLLKFIEAQDPAYYKTLDLKNLNEAVIIAKGVELAEALSKKAIEQEAKLAEANRGHQDGGAAAAAAAAAAIKPTNDPVLLEMRAQLTQLAEAVKGLGKADAVESALKELREAKAEKLINARMAEARLPLDDPEAREFVTSRLAEADRTDQTKVDAACKAVAKLWHKRSGFEGTPSMFTEAEITADAGEKFVAAVAGMIAGCPMPHNAKKPKETVEPLRGLREAYIVLTGDSEVTGRIPRNGFGGSRFGMLYEAAQTMNAQWAYVLGDSITRAMMRDYALPDLKEWEAIVEKLPIKDFRTQHRTLVGGFPTLSTVTAGNAYVGFTDVPDDIESTYAVSKKGNTQAITLEMIANDDVGKLRDITREISRAAKRTRSAAVWGPIINNSNLTVAGDATALFTVAHGNTTAAFEPLSYPAVIAAKSAMWAQRRLSGVDGTAGEYLHIRPRFLCTAECLERERFELLYSSGQPIINRSNAATEENEGRPNFLQTMNLQGITIPDLTPTSLNWFAIADPMQAPVIEFGYWGSEEPEIFVQDMPNVGSMFTNDAVTYKIRDVFGVLVKYFQGMYGQIQA